MGINVKPTPEGQHRADLRAIVFAPRKRTASQRARQLKRKQVPRGQVKTKGLGIKQSFFDVMDQVRKSREESRSK